MSSARLTPIAGICAALFSLIAAGCGASDAKGDAKPIPNVVVAPPAKATVQDYLEYTGRLEASKRVEVRSRVNGYLTAVHFRDGQSVRAGDPLFTVDPRPFQAIRDRARAGLAQAQARMRLADSQLVRLRSLNESGAASREELDRARGDAEAARAAVMLAQAELRAADLELGFTTVRAPIGGRASDSAVDAGNYVAGGAGSPILTTIVAEDPIDVAFDLSEADFERLQRVAFPETAEITVGSDTNRISARVDFVDNEVGAHTGSVRVRARAQNAERHLKPGGFARVRVPLGQPELRFLVPDASVMSDQTRKAVLVVDASGVAKPHPVEVGNLEGTSRVVTSGLSGHEKIIVSGGAKVKPGDKVKVVPAKAGA